MDYSIIKSLHHHTSSRDGLDLSINNIPNITEFDRTYNKCTNNNFNIIPSCPRLSPSANNSDIDDPMEFDGRKSTLADITMPLRINRQHTSSIDIHQDSTKLKLKFSVDRILGRDTDSSSRTSQDSGFNQNIVHDNCADCGDSIRRDTSGEISTKCPAAQYPTPFSVASMLGFNSNSAASVVRPLAMRYLQRSPPIVGNQIQPTGVHHMYQTNTQYNNHHHSHHHHHHLTTKPQHGGDRRIHHQSSITIADNSSITSNQNNAKRKRSWSRAVFSQLQRKGLEIQFQIQKYITKPDRRKLAARLGLTDAQVKVWFQNRRMKWRHTREAKLDQDKATTLTNVCNDGVPHHGDHEADDLIKHETSSSSDEDEIDVVAE